MNESWDAIPTLKSRNTLHVLANANNNFQSPEFNSMTMIKHNEHAIDSPKMLVIILRSNSIKKFIAARLSVAHIPPQYVDKQARKIILRHMILIVVFLQRWDDYCLIAMSRFIFTSENNSRNITTGHAGFSFVHLPKETTILCNKRSLIQKDVT